jgi:hypothetical protein
MLTRNACSCPRCHYFLGYSTTQPDFSSRRTLLIGSCLNCDYRLPFQAVLRGERKLPARQRTGGLNLKLIQGATVRIPRVLPTWRLRRTINPPSSAASQYYGRELRAVGQALEKLQLKNFNLKHAGRSYFIWNNDQAQKAHATDRPRDLFRKSRPAIAPTFRLDPDDLARIECAGKVRRQNTFSVTNGHKLSHLLRTLGEYINSRNQQLLGITWREQSLSVVVETAKGRRRIEEFRTDFLYDLWVRMYLRRAH